MLGADGLGACVEVWQFEATGVRVGSLRLRFEALKCKVGALT